jgi:glucan-binding YG repeat protein
MPMPKAATKEHRDRPKKSKSKPEQIEQRLTLQQRQDAHMIRHPKDLNKKSGFIPGHTTWINLNKKGNEVARARYEELERFYETHTWLGMKTGWVKNENELSIEEEFASKNKIADMVEEENPGLLEDNGGEEE